MDEFNPYAAPEVGVRETRLPDEGDEGRGVWRDGELLVMAKVARLPSRCLKCNEPATYRLKRSLAWHNKWLFLLIVFPSWIVYLIVALIVRKTAKVEFPICEEHRIQRLRGIAIAWALFLAGVVLIVVGADDSRPDLGFLILIGIVMILFGLIFGLIRGRVVPTQRIDDTHVWLKKVSPLYLAELPRLPFTDDWDAEMKSKIKWDEL